MIAPEVRHVPDPIATHPTRDDHCDSPLWRTTDLACYVGDDARPPAALAGARGVVHRELRLAGDPRARLNESIALDWLPSRVLAALWTDTAPSLAWLIHTAGMSVTPCPLAITGDESIDGEHVLHISGVGDVGYGVQHH